MAGQEDMKRLREEIAQTRERAKALDTAIRAKEKADQAMEKVKATATAAPVSGSMGAEGRERPERSPVQEKRGEMEARRAAYIMPAAPQMARRPVGRAAPLPEGPIEDFLEESIYPITDEWGNQYVNPTLDVLLRPSSVVGQDPWTNLQYFNYYMESPRKQLRRLLGG